MTPMTSPSSAVSIINFEQVNADYDVSLLYVFYYFPLEEVRRGLWKSSLFSATIAYLTFKWKIWTHYIALFYM